MTFYNKYLKYKRKYKNLQNGGFFNWFGTQDRQEKHLTFNPNVFIFDVQNNQLLNTNEINTKYYKYFIIIYNYKNCQQIQKKYKIYKLFNDNNITINLNKNQNLLNYYNQICLLEDDLLEIKNINLNYNNIIMDTNYSGIFEQIQIIFFNNKYLLYSYLLKNLL